MVQEAGKTRMVIKMAYERMGKVMVMVMVLSLREEYLREVREEEDEKPLQSFLGCY